jgi:cyclic-di-AMP phosphodiesterase PgpH
MSSSNTVRTRSERVASLQLEPSALRRQFTRLLTAHSLVQFGMALASLISILVIFRAWEPPFSYREGQIPDRDIVARIPFDIVDAQQTKLLRDQRRRETLCFYENRPQPISQLRSALQNQIFALLGDKPFEELSRDQLATLDQLIQDNSANASTIEPQTALTHIRNLLSDPDQLNKFGPVLQKILNPIADLGVLKALAHGSDQGNQRSIMVIPVGSPNDEVFADISAVRHADIVASLPAKVSEVFLQSYTSADAPIIAKLISNYLVRELPETLSYRSDLSEKARANAEAAVQEALVSYYPGVSKLAVAGQPISSLSNLPLLRAEYDAWIAKMPRLNKIWYFLSFTGIVLGLFVFVGGYINYQFDTHLLTQPVPLLRLLGLIVVTCLACRFTAPDSMRAELVPILVAVITMTITFGRQIAVLVATSLSIVITLALGLDLAELMTLCSGSCAVAMMVGRIRTRTKLIYVGLAAGAVIFLTHMAMDAILGRLMAVPLTEQVALASPLSAFEWVTLESLRQAGFGVLAAAFVALLLPGIEKIFGVQTDLSLLELGDASQSLLRQLAQRAPGTYNHSINVAAIAEAAADAIGAHGLLTRVGAYFHDIGKMFKPNYFVENQDQGSNCHDALQPAMSTLVIIAHVKDGADLARQHHLPRRIVDFIEQHHGTTLVEYFYREATKRSQEGVNKEEVSETAFRYPGPKPQSLEAAVLMLADSVESASRTLVEPTASRLQNLVDKIAMNKLLDGQFDECGMTLQQLDLVKASLVKSLTAIYHGRIKYTGQASA